jgi:hypothetical protein
MTYNGDPIAAKLAKREAAIVRQGSGRIAGTATAVARLTLTNAGKAA